jgi:SPP1 family predicted phage head-tail adaptor
MFTALPHLVAVQELTKTSLGGGAYRESWATTKTIWANVQPQNLNRDSSSFTYEKKQEYRKLNVIIRNRTGIDNSKRFLFKNRILTITNITDSTYRSRYFLCECIEEVDNK